MLSFEWKCPWWLTVEGEVAKQRRNKVQQEAEVDADIRDLLHPGFGRSERQSDNNAFTWQAPIMVISSSIFYS